MYPDRPTPAGAVSLERVGELCAHQLRDYDRKVKLPEHRFEPWSI